MIWNSIRSTLIICSGGFIGDRGLLVLVLHLVLGAPVSCEDDAETCLPIWTVETARGLGPMPMVWCPVRKV